MYRINDSPADWIDWDSGAEMTAAQAAAQLGIQAATVGDLRRNDSTFPQRIGPTRTYFAADVYGYQIVTADKARRQRGPVPRLHPRESSRSPRLFETVSLECEWVNPYQLRPDGSAPVVLKWVAYVVESFDGATPIVLAFRTEWISLQLPAEWELDALKQAARGRVPDEAAFVLPQEVFDAPAARRRRGPAALTWQRPRYSPPLHATSLDPRIRVLDSAGYWRAHWTDLAEALPGFPLPWWPEAFRNTVQMRAWRPGTAPFVVTLRAEQRPLPAPDNFREMSDEEADAWCEASAGRPNYSYLSNLVPQAHLAIRIVYADAGAALLPRC